MLADFYIPTNPDMTHKIKKRNILASQFNRILKLILRKKIMKIFLKRSISFSFLSLQLAFCLSELVFA